MSNLDKRALMLALTEDAARLGISVPELIQRITSGAQVIGDVGPTRKVQGRPTYMSTGEGHMPQIEDRLRPSEEDDFSDLVARREQALLDAGGDDLARESLFRDGEHKALQDAAGFRRSNPVSILSSVIGTQAAPTQGGPTIEVANWTGDNPDTTVVNVTFANIQRQQLATSGQLRPFGRVLFGSNGMLVTLDVDIGSGCQFTLNASQIRLLVGLDPGNNGAIDPATSTQLTGMLSFGGGIRALPITRTAYIDPGAGGGPILVPRPVFATNVIAFRKDTTGTLQLDFEDSNNVIVYTVLLAGGAQFTDPIPLSSDVTQVAVTRSVANDKTRLIFGLSL